MKDLINDPDPQNNIRSVLKWLCIIATIWGILFIIVQFHNAAIHQIKLKSQVTIEEKR